jgi:hypothetical protein
MLPVKDPPHPTLIARQVVDVRDEWVGDLYILQRYCLLLNWGKTWDTAPHHFARQVVGIFTLIEAYGPDKLVLVNSQGDPLAQGYQSRSVPQTLRTCLTLTYITEGIVVHGVPMPDHKQNRFLSKFKVAYWTMEIY